MTLRIRAPFTVARPSAPLACALLRGLYGRSASLYLRHADSRRDVRVEGVVTQFEFINPHAFITLEVREASRAPQQWRVELDDRGELSDIGMTAQTLRPGDQVIVVGSPARRETNRLSSLVSIAPPTAIASNRSVAGRGCDRRADRSRAGSRRSNNPLGIARTFVPDWRPFSTADRGSSISSGQRESRETANPHHELYTLATLRSDRGGRAELVVDIEIVLPLYHSTI